VLGNVGWAELVILVIAALVILGPERLPGAMTSLARGLRTARDYVTGAQSQLREHMGPEFDELREPLEELGRLRGISPRAAITQHLFDGDDSLFTGRFDEPAAGDRTPDRGAGTPPQGPATPPAGPVSGHPETAGDPPSSPPADPQPGAAPRYDTDAT